MDCGEDGGGGTAEGFAEGIGKRVEVREVFIGQGRVDGVIGKGFKLAAGDGAGFGQLGEFSEGIGGGFGLMKGEGIQHFRFDFRIANGFNIFTREGRYDNCTVGNGVGNDTGGGKICDGFHNGKVAVAGCGFIIDAERGCFGVGEVIDRLNAQVYIVRGILFDCGAALVKDVHCGVGKAFEAFDRLGFTFQPGVGTLAGLTGGGNGQGVFIRLAKDGESDGCRAGRVIINLDVGHDQAAGGGEGQEDKAEGEEEGGENAAKFHLGDFLSFHAMMQ